LIARRCYLKRSRGFVASRLLDLESFLGFAAFFVVFFAGMANLRVKCAAVGRPTRIMRLLRERS
jgi:hypothetical protein